MKLQKMVEYLSYVVCANAVLSGLTLMIRLYLMAWFDVEFESFGAGMGLFMSLMFSTLIGGGLYIMSKDDSVWR